MKTSRITQSFLLIYFTLLLLVSSNVLPEEEGHDTSSPEENELDTTITVNNEIDSTDINEKDSDINSTIFEENKPNSTIPKGNEFNSTITKENKLNSTIPKDNDLNSTLPEELNPTLPEELNSTLPEELNSTFHEEVNSTLPREVNSTLPGDVNSTVTEEVYSTITEYDESNLTIYDENELYSDDYDFVPIDPDINSTIFEENELDLKITKENKLNSTLFDEVNSTLFDEVNSTLSEKNNSTITEENELNSTSSTIHEDEEANLTTSNESFNSITSKDNKLSLRLLHTNNIKGHFEEHRDRSTNRNETYGGVARIAYIVNKMRNLRSASQAVLYVDVGDVSVGTVWTAVHRDKISTAFMNVLKPDVMCLGNHEFDFGIPGLLNFATNVTFPLTLANLKYNNETEVEKVIKPSVVLTVNGIKIGFVGFMTRFTKFMSHLKTMDVIDEVQAVKKECKKLTEQGIKIIIALGHTGLRMCKRIAKFVEEVDVVVCGHRHVFLFNGMGPSSEEALDSYPRRIAQKHGKLVPVVHTYGNTKYIGDLKLTFDANGTVTYSEGEPIFLNDLVPQDESVLALLEEFRPDVVKLNSYSIGQCLVNLNIYCRKCECNYGNLAVDAFIRYRLVRYRGENWTDTAVALLNSGAIRLPIVTNIRNTNVSKGDIYASFPYRHPLYIVKMTGENLLNILQQSAKSYDKGGFLITAGLKVLFDVDPSLTPIINSVFIRSIDAHQSPEYVPVEKKAQYNFITTEYLVSGGDGYFIIKNNAISITALDVTDADAILEYFNVIKDVMPAIEGRYIFQSLNSSTQLISSPEYMYINVFIYFYLL